MKQKVIYGRDGVTFTLPYLAEAFAIINEDGSLHCLEGSPVIFEHKGPHAEANAAKHHRRVARVLIIELPTPTGEENGQA